MAFDLNKNDGSVKAPSKFDLSKEQQVVSPAPKSKKWLFGLLGFIIVVGGVMYYSFPAKNAEAVTIAPTPSAAKAVEKQNADADPAVAGQSTGSVVATNNEALNQTIPATFSQGSTSLLNTDKMLVERIVAYLTENPGASIIVNGYASSDGSLALNQTISQTRADAFKQYLVSRNIDETRVTALGKGIENPVASNSSNAGRAKNRRIEVMFP